MKKIGGFSRPIHFPRFNNRFPTHPQGVSMNVDRIVHSVAGTIVLASLALAHGTT
jgi:hypothetical protein